MMGNSNVIHKRSLMRFHDGLAWLMQIAMFLTLGLQVFPTQLVPIAGTGLLLALFLMVFARPIAVFLALAFTSLSLREKTMVSWVGLRGAVPIILATFPLLAGISQATMMFNLVFFIVLASVLLQGTSIPLVARWLKVDEPLRQRLDVSPVWNAPTGLKSGLVELTIPESSVAIGKRLIDIGLPKPSVVILIGRKKQCFVPDGSTVLDANDSLLAFTDETSSHRLRALLETRGSTRMADAETHHGGEVA